MVNVRRKAASVWLRTWSICSVQIFARGLLLRAASPLSAEHGDVLAIRQAHQIAGARNGALCPIRIRLVLAQRR